MAAELSPEEALQIATETRRAAAPPRVPGWFPTYAGVTFALAMIALGLSSMAGAHQPEARAFGITGGVLIVAHLGMHAELVRRWRRGGLVPLSDTRSTRARSRKSIWFLAAAFLVGGACFLAGSLGWGWIAFGLIIGAETWYRVTGWTRPNE